MEKLRELDLLGESEPVEIPDLENEDLIEENSLSVIVRCLNPTVHKVGGLVKALPPIWGMEERLRGRGVGEDRVQFIFENEADFYHVLYRGPWFVNGWIVTIDQWKPNPGPEFLKHILFWVRIKGIPNHFLKKKVVESIVKPLGKVDVVELHAKNSSSLEYVRAKIWIKADEPLVFRKSAYFKTGEVAQLELTYEKLLKICFLCKRLKHDQSKCLFQIREEPSNRRGNQSVKKATSRGKGKGKEIASGEEPEPKVVTNLRRSSNPVQSEPKSRQRSVKDRLQWTS
ncbi:unnamed protein product [Arabidopsis thaliana]|uniref:DUF4283 domain-containing protein n=1 Tax=Arabidopsis thaliana TaxID=3702 RepID=A0A654ESR4_ARATH|nr:unnamed protein product [Arabidopsis thaliana]